MPEKAVREFVAWGGPWDGQKLKLEGDQDGIPVPLAPSKDGPRWGLYRLDIVKGHLKWIQRAERRA